MMAPGQNYLLRWAHLTGNQQPTNATNNQQTVTPNARREGNIAGGGNDTTAQGSQAQGNFSPFDYGGSQPTAQTTVLNGTTDNNATSLQQAATGQPTAPEFEPASEETKSTWSLA